VVLGGIVEVSKQTDWSLVRWGGRTAHCSEHSGWVMTDCWRKRVWGSNAFTKLSKLWQYVTSLTCLREMLCSHPRSDVC